MVKQVQFGPGGSENALPAGKLYEASAVVEADQATVTPLVANFNARTSDDDSYRALATVLAPEAINPSAVPAGGKSTDKIYFDVTGANPTSVVYSDGVQDLLLWTAAPPPASGSMPSGGYAPAGATGQSGSSTGSLPSGTTPARKT